MTSTNFLRRVLFADATTSAAFGLLLLFGADAVSRILNVPAPLLRPIGLSLIPFALFVVFVATRERLARGAVWTIIVLNAAWVVASVLVLMAAPIDPNRLGIAFILVQAVLVAAFAEVQYVGLRRAAA
jgi:hypothetical protein